MQKKTYVLFVLSGYAILIISCLSTAANPAAIPETPTPSEINIGPYEISVKDAGEVGKLVSNAEFWFRGTRLGNVIFDNQGYHTDCAEGEKLLVWVESYFIEQVICNTDQEVLDVSLRRYALMDIANYIWVGSNKCITCHVGKTDELTGRYHNEFIEWQKRRTF